MGTKPVHVFAGLALVGVLASGCERSSTVSGFEGSAKVGSGTTGFNTQGAVAGRAANGSFNASTQSGLAAAASVNAGQPVNTAAFTGTVSNSMPAVTHPSAANVPPLVPLNVPPVTMSSLNTPAGVGVPATQVPQSAVNVQTPVVHSPAPMTTTGGPMTYGSSTMPMGRSVESPVVPGSVPGQPPMGGMPAAPMTPPPQPMAPGGSMMPN